MLQGFEQIWETLTQIYPSLPLFLIFYGEKGIGKSTLAKQFAGFVLHENPKTLEKGARQNYRYINFEDQELKLEIVPIIQDFLSHKYEQYKVLIIDNADNLNVHAYNSLLKSFEKEYEKTFIILIVHNIDKFPATLRSRFFEIGLSSPNLNHPLAPYAQGNYGLLKWVEEQGGLSFINYLKNLMLINDMTKEHEDFIQKYKEQHAFILDLIKNILYLESFSQENQGNAEKNVLAFERLNQFMIRSEHTHIPAESFIALAPGLTLDQFLIP